MKLIYISGPITAPTAWEVEQNVRRAEAASMELFRRGVTNVCVHAMGRFMDGLLAHGAWMAHDYRIIDRCDAVYVCAASFGHSKGTVLEVGYARRQGKPVFFVDELEALVAWAAGTERGSITEDTEGGHGGHKGEGRRGDGGTGGGVS